jgi:thiol-disulfide isomerase/thioredoxin
MKHTLKLIIVTILYVSDISFSYAQGGIKIGEPFPDFTFLDTDHYKQKTFSTKDFRGKWLVLDYWSVWCGTCISSMPKMSKMQSELQDQVQIVMVGKFYNNKTSDDLKATKKLFEKVRKEKRLDLTVAYDTILSKVLNVVRLPDIFIIDPNGILRARVTKDLNSLALKEIMKGNNQEILKALIPKNDELARRGKNYSERRNNVLKENREFPLLVPGNNKEDANYIYRSMVVPFNSELSGRSHEQSNGRLEFINYDLISLYRLAYFGHDYWEIYTKRDYKDSMSQVLYEEFWVEPLLEIKDSSSFISEFKLDKQYSYSVWYPRVYQEGPLNSHPWLIRNRPDLRKSMQDDLKKAFGYDVSIEVKKKPYYRLVVHNNDSQKLRTKGGTNVHDRLGRYIGINLQNFPVDALVKYLAYNVRGRDSGGPIIDETRIDYNIDIKVMGGTIEEFRKSLRKSGLDLVKGEKEMKVLVIKDAEPMRAKIN